MTAALPQGRPRAWALVVFLVLFVGVTTAILSRVRAPQDPPRENLLQRTIAVHDHVDRALAAAGLHPGEILLSKTEIRDAGPERRSEHRTEILVDEAFPLDRWSADLEASLHETGAALERSSAGGASIFRVTYSPPGREEAFPVDHLVVRTRPALESLAPQNKDGSPRAAIVIDDLGQNPARIIVCG